MLVIAEMKLESAQGTRQPKRFVNIEPSTLQGVNEIGSKTN
jgi:hypothetical protein